MSKPPKVSVAESDEAPAEPAEEKNAVLLPFYPNVDDPSECERYIKEVFEAVVKYYGEDEARRIFGPYGRPRTKREINDEQNEELLVAYYLECIKAEKLKRKPNVRQLARRLAEVNKLDPVALERKIWRLVKEKPEIKNRENSLILLLAQSVIDKYRIVDGDRTFEVSVEPLLDVLAGKHGKRQGGKRQGGKR